MSQEESKDANGKKEHDLNKKPSQVLLFSPKNDVEYEVADLTTLQPTYSQISYFGGNCIPCIGKCGFLSLIYETLNANDDNNEDAWTTKTKERKTLNSAEENNSKRENTNEASGAACAGIESQSLKKPQTIDNEVQTSGMFALNENIQKHPEKSKTGVRTLTDPDVPQKQTNNINTKVPDNYPELSDDTRENLVVITDESIKEEHDINKNPSVVVLFSSKNDVEYVAAEPTTLSPTYSQISYFVGNCIPCIGKCGFLSLIFETLNANVGNNEDAWKTKAKERKTLNSAKENSTKRESIDEANGPSCIDIESQLLKKPQTIDNKIQKAAMIPLNENVQIPPEKLKAEVRILSDPDVPRKQTNNVITKETLSANDGNNEDAWTTKTKESKTLKSAEGNKAKRENPDQATGASPVDVESQLLKEPRTIGNEVQKSGMLALKENVQKHPEKSKAEVRIPDEPQKQTNDTITKVAEPTTLLPTYSQISYLVGNCIPCIGKCGFLSLICETLNATCNIEDAWKTKTKESKTLNTNEAIGASCVDIESQFLKKPQTIDNEVQKSGMFPLNENVQIPPEKSKAGVRILSDPDVPQKLINNTTKVQENCPELPAEADEKPVVNTHESTNSNNFDDEPIKPRKKSIRTKSMVHTDTPFPLFIETTEPKTVIDILTAKNTAEAKVAPQDNDKESNEVKNINIREIKAQSDKAFKETLVNTFKPGMTGLKEYVGKRNQMIPIQKNQWDFLDYFAAKDGGRYLGDLEHYYNQYYKQLTELISINQNPKRKTQIDEAEKLISKLHEIKPIEVEKQLLKFNFPLELEQICSKFSIDYKGKFVAMAKMHNYITQMIQHWSRRLETKVKPVLTDDVYEVATETMADIMVICYAIVKKIVEFIHKLVEGSTKDQKEKFTLEFLYKTLRSMLDCICDEINAIAEACGQIVIQIPKISKDDATNLMRRIYTQVNLANMTGSRLFEVMEPLVQTYYIIRHVTQPDRTASR